MQEVSKKSCWFLLLHNLREKCPLRSSHQRCSVKQGVLKNFANFTGKHLWRSLFWQKQPLEVVCRKGFLEFFQISQENTCVGVSLIKFVKKFTKKRLQHKCFPVKIFKNTDFEEHVQTTASVLNKVASPKTCNLI